ncbi:MAG TPA: hypothetical protein VHT02_06130, partial [Methylocella sp.]|nr:hypothetical protein [Methylocella sp.]
APGILGGTGMDYAANLAANRAGTAEAQSAHPADAMAGNIAGSLPYAALPLEGIGGAALAGGVSGAASSPDWSNAGQTAGNAALGAGIGGAVGAAGKVAGVALGRLAPAAADASIPTAETIGPMVSDAYRQVKDLGAAYTPEAYGSLVAKINSDARAANINPKLNPRAAAAIESMQDHADAALQSGQPVTLTDLDQLRQFVNRNVTSSIEPSERYFGNQIRSNIDDFIASAGPDQMAAGAGPDAAAAIRNARDLAQRQFKAADLASALESADLRAASTYSGGNADNAIRQNMRRLYEGGNWTPQEAALAERTIRGGPGQGLLRYVGKTLNPSGIVGAGELLTGLTGHPAALGVGALGYGAKKASEALTNANARNLMATILRGGTRGPTPASVNLSPYSNALAAALAGYTGGGQR